MADRDLYGELGLPPGASEADIKRAFRQQAKKAHPDAGGTAEKFGALRLAHDVLIDPDRRAKYDRTGKFEDAPVDNTQSAIIEIVAGALDDAVQTAIKHNRDPAQVDLKAGILASLDTGVQQMNQELDGIRKAMKLARKLAKRWRRKRKKGDQDKPNMLALILEERVRTMEGTQKQVEERLRILGLARTWMADYEFDAERPQFATAFVTFPSTYP